MMSNMLNSAKVYQKNLQLYVFYLIFKTYALITIKRHQWLKKFTVGAMKIERILFVNNVAHSFETSNQ